MSHRKTALFAVLAAVLAIPAGANAAEATVNATSKTATITGSITDPLGAYDTVGFFNEGTQVAGHDTCTEPLCQTNTLHVGPDGAQLKLDGTSDAENLSLEVVSPDGTTSYYNTDEFTSERHLTFDAAPGDWTIRVGGSSGMGFSYDLAFTFRTPEDVAQDPPPPADEEE